MEGLNDFYGLNRIKKLKIMIHKLKSIHHTEETDYLISELSIEIEKYKRKMMLNDPTVSTRKEFEEKLKRSFINYENKKMEARMRKLEAEELDKYKKTPEARELEFLNNKVGRNCKYCNAERSSNSRCINISDYRNKSNKYKEMKRLVEYEVSDSPESSLNLVGRLKGEDLVFCHEKCYEEYMLKYLGVTNYVKYKAKEMDKARYLKLSRRVLKYGMIRKFIDWDITTKIKGNRLELYMPGGDLKLILSPVGLFYIEKIGNDLNYRLIHTHNYTGSRAKEGVHEEIKSFIKKGFSRYNSIDSYIGNRFKKSMYHSISYYINYIMSLRRKEETLDKELISLKKNFNEMLKNEENQ